MCTASYAFSYSAPSYPASTCTVLYRSQWTMVLSSTLSPAFDRWFHHCKVGDPSVDFVPATDFVFLQGVEDLVEAVVGGEQDLGVDSRLLHNTEVYILHSGPDELDPGI